MMEPRPSKSTAEPRALLIAGPTASGKSERAMRAAEALHGEIVNADSMQLYADLRILTARPSAEDEAKVRHHLFGVADAAEAWSVGRWLRAVETTLGDIASRGRTAIIVGGTGLYFSALTRGLAHIPPVPMDVRAATLAHYEHVGEDEFRAHLAHVDPVAATRIAQGDRQRLTRAWEVHAATGRAITDWQTQAEPLLPPGYFHAEVLEPPREALFVRCDARLLAMVEAGALQEVGRLLARGLPNSLPAMKALGVAPFAAHLRGDLGRAEAIASAQQDTRRYAKRQLTWFRNQTPDWPRTVADTVVEPT